VNYQIDVINGLGWVKVNYLSLASLRLMAQNKNTESENELAHRKPDRDFNLKPNLAVTWQFDWP